MMLAMATPTRAWMNVGPSPRWRKAEAGAQRVEGIVEPALGHRQLGRALPAACRSIASLHLGEEQERPLGAVVEAPVAVAAAGTLLELVQQVAGAADLGPHVVLRQFVGRHRQPADPVLFMQVHEEEAVLDEQAMPR
jgi:hypothetical protein